MITLDDLLAKTDDQANPLTNTGLQAAAIDCFGAVEEIQSGTYNVLRDLYAKRVYTDYRTVEELTAEIKTGEEEYADLYFTEVQLIAKGARSKSGKLFATKVLPASYVNSRNTLVKALEYGIDIRDKGKSELEKLNKEARKAAKDAAGTDGDDPTGLMGQQVDARRTLEGLLATATAYAEKHGMSVTYAVTEA